MERHTQNSVCKPFPNRNLEFWNFWSLIAGACFEYTETWTGRYTDGFYHWELHQPTVFHSTGYQCRSSKDKDNTGRHCSNRAPAEICCCLLGHKGCCNNPSKVLWNNWNLSSAVGVSRFFLRFPMVYKLHLRKERIDRQGFNWHKYSPIEMDWFIFLNAPFFAQNKPGISKLVLWK